VTIEAERLVRLLVQARVMAALVVVVLSVLVLVPDWFKLDRWFPFVQVVAYGDLAKAEPKTLRLHVTARLTHGQRQRWLRIQHPWPWAHQLAAAFARLATLPNPPVDLPPRPDDQQELPAKQHVGHLIARTDENNLTEINNSK
jgi:hypothetical protein